MRSISIATLVILILFAALFSGCNLTQPPTPIQSPLPTPTATPEPSPSPSPTATPIQGLITLKLWAPDFLNPYAEGEETANAPMLNEQLMTFNDRHQDVQVQVIVKKAKGPGGLYHLLSTASDAAPSVLPDLILLSQTDLRAALQGGFIQPLPVALPEDDYFPFALAGQKVDEQRYGFPYVVRADHMVYRQGVSATPPLTWTSVLSKGYTMLWPAASSNQLADDALLAAYLSTGGAVVDENGKPTLEREKLESLYGFFLQLMERNQINPEQALSLTDATACWTAYQERAAQVSPAPASRYWVEAPENSRPAWVPTPDGDPVGIAHVWAIAMATPDPSRQEAAVTLAQWLTSSERMANLTRSTGLLPPQYQALQLWGLLPEETAFLEEFLSAASPTLPATVNEPVRRALQAGLEALLTEEVKTPTAAATHALANLRE